MRKKIISSDELIDLAMDIIKEGDLEACTIRELASRSNIAVGTVYNYFPSHKELFERIFKKSWQTTIDKIQKDLLWENSDAMSLFSELYNLLKEDIGSRKGIGHKVVPPGGIVFNKKGPFTQIFENLCEHVDRILQISPRYQDFPAEKRKRYARRLLLLTMDSIFRDSDLSGETGEKELIDLFLNPGYSTPEHTWL